MKKYLTIQNKSVVVTINLKGGAYSDFHMIENPLNPLDWEQAETPSLPSFRGHFVCFDRWGPPSEGEAKNGFKHHGEVNDQVWELLKESEKSENYIQSTMRCSLPMGGMQLTRDIYLSSDQPLMKVTEKVKNLNKFGRMYNIVQHVTLAPPFLDKKTIFDNNTDKGFENKENGSLDQETPVLYWPDVIHKNQNINLRHFKDEWPRVSSFKFKDNDKIGWTTVANTDKNLMLGYVWDTDHYPWVNYWRSMQNNIPSAFGIEFGTTGLHEPFPIVAKKGNIFGQNIYDFIDANDVKSKSFIAFMATIPSDYKGVKEIVYNNSELIIKENSDTLRDIIYKI